MEVPTPTPIQIYLLPDQLEELQALAARWQVAVEEVARQGVVTFLLSQRMANNPLLEGELDDDPLHHFIRPGPSPAREVARTHDEYIMGLETESNHPSTSAP